MWKHYRTFDWGRRCDVCHAILYWSGWWSGHGMNTKRLCGEHYKELQTKLAMTSDFAYVYALHGRKVKV